MRRIVERELLGREVASVDLRLPKVFRDSPLPTPELLVGRRPLVARRRAKVLIIDWTDDLSTLMHFKLSGQLAVVHAPDSRYVAGHPIPVPEGRYPHKTTHLVIAFTDGTMLYYSDLRQFGWIRLMPTADVDAALAAFAFGPEGVGADAITADDLGQRLARRRIPLKVALLDQQLVAGLGNIYVDEALHYARLHPRRPANSLEPDEVSRLRTAIIWSLERGLEQGGATIVHRRAFPRDGFPQVHALEGDPCRQCGAPITKIRVGGRGTYLCPSCQTEKVLDPETATSTYSRA